MRLKKLTLTAVLLACALTIFIVELQLPALAPIPGIKLGLANIVTLVAIVWLGRGDAFVLLLLRIILGSIFSGRMVSFIYSLSGGLLCFAVMAITVGFFGRERLWIVSVFGAVAHNAGQLLAAAAIMSSVGVFAYFPVLIVSGIVTGAFTGLCAQLALKRTEKVKDRFLK